jgi:exosome complex exonuclease RRP6
MAGLIGMFQSVPPVIRRRAKELLDVITDCVKEYSAQTTVITPEGEENKPVTGVVDVAVDAKQDADASRLWSNGWSIC